mgnify:FL=1
MPKYERARQDSNLGVQSTNTFRLDIHAHSMEFS